jgi:sarcosine/dimethylglycine N-methyltransferase
MSEREIEAQASHYRATYDTAMSRLLTRVWGANLHMGLFTDPAMPLPAAQMQAKRHMAEAADLHAGQQVIEAACGVGSTARFLAATYDVHMHATNIAEAQLAEGRELTEQAGLAHLVDYRFADYHALPFEAASCDVWWCQEALLYSVDKRLVMEEAIRVVRPGGRLIMSDLLLDDRVSGAERERFTTMLKAPNMWSLTRWDALLAELPLRVLERRDWAAHTLPTFRAVLQNFEQARDEFSKLVGTTTVQEMFVRLKIQLDAAIAGNLGWCFFALSR